MKVVAQSKWFSILEANPIDEIIASGDEVLILARDSDGNFLLVEEPSFAFGGTQLYLPGGLIENEDTILETAQRELREETGFAASHLKSIGKVRAWPKYLQVTSHLVIATELYAAPLAGDEQHDVILHRLSLPTLQAGIASGAICDARIIAALSLYAGAAS